MMTMMVGKGSSSLRSTRVVTTEGEHARVEVIPNGNEEEVEVEESGQGTWVVRWWRSRISAPFMIIIRRGSEPKQLAMSASIGVTLGVFPIYGVTVFLCFIAMCILRSKCHAPTLMLANFIATPLEILLIVPYLRLGEWMTNGGHIMLTRDALWQAITGNATQDVIMGLVHALVGWTVTMPLLLFILYAIFSPIFSWLIRRYGPKTPDLEIGWLHD